MDEIVTAFSSSRVLGEAVGTSYDASYRGMGGRHRWDGRRGMRAVRGSNELSDGISYNRRVSEKLGSDVAPRAHRVGT